MLAASDRGIRCMWRSLFLGCIVACLSLQGALFSAAAEASPDSTMTTASPSFTLGPAKTCIGQPAPAFTKAEALLPDGTFGELSLSDYKGKFVVLLFYPLDFTFVCPTELIAFSERAKEFRDIDAEVIGISVDSKFSHLAWTKLPRTKGGLGEMNIPLIADVTKHISADYGVLIPDQGVALRGLFVIDPKGTLRQITINDLPIGRDVDEALRLVQAIDFVDKHGEVCPAGWRPGKKSMKADPEGSLEYFGSLAEETATTVKKQKN